MTTPEGPLVLYADDERGNRIVFEQSLIGEFNIQTVPDARTAIEVMGQVEVAVLLTDIRMPDMTGDELLRVVKDRWPSTIRMVITAHSDIEPILAAINEGLVARYIIKPWERDELLQLLRWGIEAWSFGRESATLQRRLLETERLATLGSIAGAVVHDLNQPLAGLVINSERLAELGEAAGPLRELLAGAPLSSVDRAPLIELADELIDLGSDLRDNAHHMRQLIASLGQFLYRRHPAAPPAPSDPMPIVRNAVAVCHDIAIRARGVISYDGPAALPKVRMAGTELTQVLINLVANAAQAVLARDRPGGRVTVLARIEEAVVVFQVRDDGIGMSPEVLAKVGTPFFTTRDDGIGLGMAQCQRLVGKAGGTFRVESEAGVGTTVTFVLTIAA